MTMMAFESEPLLVGNDPIDLTADKASGGLGLQVDIAYTIQNIGVYPVSISERKEQPVDDYYDHSQYIPPGHTWATIPTLDLPVWVWTYGDKQAYIVVSEAPAVSS